MIIGLPHEDIPDPSSCEGGGGEGRWVTKNPSFYPSLAEESYTGQVGTGDGFTSDFPRPILH